jgi:hypothetical protein
MHLGALHQVVAVRQMAVQAVAVAVAAGAVHLGAAQLLVVHHLAALEEATSLGRWVT